ncbi:hypothetical protein J132_09478 [Termitomyces sp. J132]|nr:hypothetical protein H2248_006104 [Termitomyces sp. 'cryptogamus']KNZ73837.1 hypothetical protein J132_09478 [Termitomyces sp. J132]
MTRILPRLLGRLERTSQRVSLDRFVLPRRRPRSLYRSVPTPPSFQPAHHPKSILLYDPPTNPITSSRVYDRHKTLPPLPRRFDKPRPRKTTDEDGPRAMTLEERKFWSSPYLRMIASPLRQCIITSRFLPNDFLIRLAIQRIPKSHYPSKWKRPNAPQTLLPDGLQHTKFTVRRSDKAHYVPCTRTSIALLAEPSVKRRAAHGVLVHPLLAEQIAHLLRLRVLQELEVLIDNLEAAAHKSLHRKPATSKPKTPITNPAPVPRLLRRLTHSELHTIRTTQTIPHPGALAVLIVPPLQKDSVTGLRPAPNMSPAPPPPPTSEPTKPLTLPACVLYPTQPDAWDEEGGTLPQEKVPLYNGVVMFPERGQRAALEGLLRRVLEIEWRADQGCICADAGKGGKNGGEEKDGEQKEEEEEAEEGKDMPKKSKSKSKPSHAFLLYSDEESVLRGDTVGIAIALWRLRMFEDKGEDVETQRVGGWEWTKKRT